MSAGSLTLNGVPATNVLIEGQLNGKEVVLNTIGADMARARSPAPPCATPTGAGLSTPCA
jgi:hypothetical protein